MGDIIAPNNLDAMRAVGFLVSGPHDTVVPVVDRMRATMRQDELEDTIGVVGQTFLGLTVNCARCHDHKFDPITAKEYYQIASALAGADHGEREFTPPETTRQLAAWQSRIDELTKALQDQETPIRAKILAERVRTTGDVPLPNLPVPIAAWDFTRDAKDQVCRMHMRLVGTAKLEREGLVVDGSSCAMTAPLEKDLGEKTLQVRVRLQSLQQSGGGAISLQTIDGHTFDATVFGELNRAADAGEYGLPANVVVWRIGRRGGGQAVRHHHSSSSRRWHDRLLSKRTALWQTCAKGSGRPLRHRESPSCLRPSSRDGTRRQPDAEWRDRQCSTYDRALSPEEAAVSSDTTNTYITEAEIASSCLQINGLRGRRSRMN